MPGYERRVFYATDARMRPVFKAAGDRLHALFHPTAPPLGTGINRAYMRELYPITNQMLVDLLLAPIHTGTPRDLTPALVTALDDIANSSRTLVSWYAWLYAEGLQYGAGLIAPTPEGSAVTHAWREVYPSSTAHYNTFPAMRFLHLATTGMPYMHKLTTGYHLPLAQLSDAIDRYLGGLTTCAAYR